MAYSLCVGAILLTFFVCSYLRYRAGYGFSIFFTYAVIPYLVFRLGFLFGIIGLQSPFAYLPDNAFGYFLKNPWTNQAFGVCLEALIMALAVISRARWLQSELTTSARKQTELIEQQNIVLEAKVTERTKELKSKHDLIVSSVNYASRLQRSQLPRQIRLDGRFKSLAAIWEPRDTIGGDLWWISSSQFQDHFTLAVADCTGHGVPGAMLSLLVSTSLERIYTNEPKSDPVRTLMSLDHFVRAGLNQDVADSESDDGCDAAIISVNRTEKTLTFAGAKIDLFQLQTEGQVQRHAAARISLGYRQPPDEEELPVSQQISWRDGDIFILVTDGFTDQIGGDGKAPRAFGYRRLEQLLSGLAGQPASVIAESMRAEFNRWQGAQARRDDVTAIVFAPDFA